jgi:hypothetical protein
VNESFEKRIRAAAHAAWRVVLIGYALLTLTWGVYLGLVTVRPAWLLAMWGQGVTWEFMQTLSLWFLGVFKLFLWFLFLAALWLTLWARRLRNLDQQK